VDSLCPFCGVGCQVTYQVKDEKVIYAEAATARPIATACA
jgi:predicted molibdopterin-dependent oxidoreductase YjgC